MHTKRTSSRKILIILAVLGGLMCVYWLIWHSKKAPSAYEPNPVRPENFPEVLVVPEEAESPDYVTPRIPGVYSLTYLVEETYPGVATHPHISQHLLLHGFRKLAYDLLNPKFSDQQRWTIDDTIRTDKTKKHWLSEHWINEQGEVVSVILAYNSPVEGIPEPNKLYVNLCFFEKDSWIRLHVVKYKKLHPEESHKDDHAEQK